jgi:hypothetical protein
MSTTPKPVADALLADGEQVGGARLRELTIGLMIVLQEIDSPLFRAQDYTDIGWLRTAYVLTLPAAEARRTASDPAALDAAAVAWSDTLPAGAMPELIRACGRIADRALGVAAPGGGAEPGPEEAGDPGAEPPAGNAPGAPGTDGSQPSGASRHFGSARPSTASRTASPSPASSSPAGSGA